MRTAQNVWEDMTGANFDQCAANKLDRPACNRAPNSSTNKRDRASHKRNISCGAILSVSFLRVLATAYELTLPVGRKLRYHPSN